jgi:hypothetical protein
LASRGNFKGWWGKLTIGVLGWVVLAGPGPAGAGGEKVYISKRYGYGLHYPADCGLKAAAAGVYVDLSFQGRRLPTVSVQKLDETGKQERKGSPDMWREFMLDRAKVSCDADGPDGTVYCQGVQKESTWKTKSGLRVLEVYLLKVQEQYGPPRQVTTIQVGPIYAVDISRPGYLFGLLVGSGHDYPRTLPERKVIRKIVESVYLIPESDFEPPKPRLVGPGPLFEGRPGRALMPSSGK